MYRINVAIFALFVGFIQLLQMGQWFGWVLLVVMLLMMSLAAHTARSPRDRCPMCLRDYGYEGTLREARKRRNAAAVTPAPQPPLSPAAGAPTSPPKTAE